MKHGILSVIAALSMSMGTFAQFSFHNAVQSSGFRGNLGQIKNQHGEVNRDVKYMFSGNGFNLQLKKNSFSYEVIRITNEIEMPESGVLPRYEEDLFDLQNPVVHVSRVDVTLEGAHPDPQIVTGEANGSYFNYYLNLKEEAPVKNVQCYNRILYKNIYPEIDLLFISGEENQPLAYEFIVHPGGDPARIRMRYDGAKGIRHQADGTLEVLTGQGTVTEGKPFSYLFADGREVASSYDVTGNRVTFDLPDYDRSQTLVIDPTLMWSTYYGGENTETIFESEIATDGLNKVIMSGSTESETGIATEGAYDVTYKKFTDIFIVKFKENGKIAWGTYFGGEGKDGTFGCTVDHDNHIIISGSTSTDSGMATAGAYKDTLTGTQSDILLSKFKPNGDLVWSTYYGGIERDHIRTCIVQESNNILFCGWTSSEGMATPGAYDTTYGGTGDALLGQFTKDGWPVWITYWSGNEDDRSHTMTFDVTDPKYTYVVGTCESTVNFIKDSPWQQTRGSLVDAFLAKWDTLGNYYWGTYIGGKKDDRGRGVVLDGAGNVYVAGYTQSQDSIASPGAYQETWGGGYSGDSIPNDDGYLMKFDHDGHYLWGTYYGGDKTEFLRGLAIDSQAYLYAVGDAQSSYNIATPNGFFPEKIANTNSDGMFSKWDTSGNLIWGSYLGSDKVDESDDVIIYKGTGIMVSVETRGAMPVTPGAYQTKNNGAEDVMFYHFDAGNTCYDAYEDLNDDYNKNSPELKGFQGLNESIYGWSAVINDTADQDYFKIKPKAGEPNYMIILDKMTVNYDLEILNKSGAQIGLSANPGTAADTVVLNALPQGTDYIHVLHDGVNVDTENCYRLRVYKSSVPFSIPEGEKKSPPAAEEKDLILFPNPVQDQLHIRLVSAETGAVQLTVTDLLGRVVFRDTRTMQAGLQQWMLPVQELDRGAYYLHVESAEQEWEASFVKQ